MRKALPLPLLALAALLLLSTCAGPGIMTQLASKRYLGSQGFYAQIPFKSLVRVITVEVQLNNQERPYTMLWDTGAGYTVLTPRVVKELQADTLHYINVSDTHGNSSKLPVVLVQDLRMGGVSFKETVAIVTDYGPDNPLNCVAPDGILGANVMQLCHWKVDYEDSTFTITDDWGQFTELIGQTGQRMVSNKFSGRPKTSFLANNTKVNRALMDSGFSGFIDINEKDLPENHPFWQNRRYSKSEDNSTFGLYGNAKVYVKETVADTMIIAGQRLYNVPVSVEEGRSKLGNSFFSYYDTYLDFKEDQFYLIPNGKDRVVETYRGIGSAPFYKTPEFFVLMDLTVGSPADEAGFVPGDTITHVNGKRPGELFTDYCDFFVKYRDWMASTDTVTFLKKGATQPVTMVRRPLF